MSIEPGTHKLGPENATLTVATTRMGAASMAGHDLVIEVSSWEAELDTAKDPALTFTADPRSLRVREGTGGVTELDDDDKAGIEQTIDEEVLKGATIAFRSTALELDAGGNGATVQGELELGGTRRPISFQLRSEDGRLSGRVIVKQSDWGIKPYSALFGTLKVADEVEVAVEAGVTEPLIPVDGLGVESSLETGGQGT
jgi:polyisoprenoid-binding protein YceI